MKKVLILTGLLAVMLICYNSTTTTATKVNAELKVKSINGLCLTAQEPCCTPTCHAPDLPPTVTNTNDDMKRDFTTCPLNANKQINSTVAFDTGPNANISNNASGAVTNTNKDNVNVNTRNTIESGGTLAMVKTCTTGFNLRC